MAAERDNSIKLPEHAMEVVAQVVSRDGFASASEYIEALVMADQLRDHQAEIERRLVESINSGPSFPVNDAWWESMRKRVAARLAEREKPAA